MMITTRNIHFSFTVSARISYESLTVYTMKCAPGSDVWCRINSAGDIWRAYGLLKASLPDTNHFKPKKCFGMFLLAKRFWEQWPGHLGEHRRRPKWKKQKQKTKNENHKTKLWKNRRNNEMSPLSKCVIHYSYWGSERNCFFNTSPLALPSATCPILFLAQVSIHFTENHQNHGEKRKSVSRKRGFLFYLMWSHTAARTTTTATANGHPTHVSVTQKKCDILVSERCVCFGIVRQPTGMMRLIFPEDREISAKILFSSQKTGLTRK